ncbi:MAG: NitT/TauT family transport system permease protein [Pseudonocardiales bacterium]|jgi:NitT/TauT family transport system permease protein|nr:NitT/TauT family transport system permease protein [Pseudonocardiales bacterium]MDT4962094.1 NitT/TauT family transport system permease protein [Pseudonocardiales bacterium]
MAGHSVVTAPALASDGREDRIGPSRWSRVGRAALRFLREELLVSLAALAVGAMAWQLVAVLIDAAWLPTFSSVISHCRDLLGQAQFRSALRDSISDVLVGYGISVVLGGVIGIGMGLNRYIDWAFVYYLDLLLFIPPIVTAPIFLIIFGLSKTTLLAVIVVFASTVIAVNCKAAVEGVDESLREVPRVFGASTLQTIVRVQLRAALPLVFTGLYLGVGRAVKGMIIGQLFIAVIGLGAYEARFEQAFDADGIWSIALIVVVAALVLSWVVRFVDGIVNHWAYSPNGGSS